MRHDPHAIMFFAAGFGTRMGALTRDRPKPLVEVAGRPLIDHARALADAAGIARQVANAHYRAGQIEAHLAGTGCAVSVESPDILDTGGGLRQALPLLNDVTPHRPVFTLNTDAVWTGRNPLATLRAAWDPERMDALLLLVPADRAMGHAGAGDFARDVGGRLRRGAGHVFTGAQILSPARLDVVADRVFSLNRVWDAIAADGRLHGVLHPGGWCDVGRPEGIAQAQRLLADPPATA